MAPGSGKVYPTKGLAWADFNFDLNDLGRTYKRHYLRPDEKGKTLFQGIVMSVRYC